MGGLNRPCGADQRIGTQRLLIFELLLRRRNSTIVIFFDERANAIRLTKGG
jgi:hypothetical protein